MSQSSLKTAGVIDLEVLTNSQGASEDELERAVGDKVVAKTASHPPGVLGTGNGETVSDIGPSSDPHATLNQGHAVVPSLTPLDLTRPVKTEGEASPSMSTVSQPPPTDGASIFPASQTQGAPLSGPQTAPGDASGDALNTPSPSLPAGVASLGTFGSPLTALGTQLNLTPEEQSAAYRKANILALSALAKKGGPNAREMLAVQGKLQEFLTNLITLAGNSGQQLKSTVQMLVQQLVVSAVFKRHLQSGLVRIYVHAYHILDEMSRGFCLTVLMYAVYTHLYVYLYTIVSSKGNSHCHSTCRKVYSSLLQLYLYMCHPCLHVKSRGNPPCIIETEAIIGLTAYSIIHECGQLYRPL